MVKAYDTVNHLMLIEMLNRYGAPSKYVDLISRMHFLLTTNYPLGRYADIDIIGWHNITPTG